MAVRKFSQRAEVGVQLVEGLLQGNRFSPYHCPRSSAYMKIKVGSVSHPVPVYVFNGGCPVNRVSWNASNGKGDQQTAVEWYYRFH